MQHSQVTIKDTQNHSGYAMIQGKWLYTVVSSVWIGELDGFDTRIL